MKKTKRTILMLAIVCSLFSVTALLAQGDKANRPSPPATATGKVGAATIKVAYSSPSVKGRKIWGDLVPYGKVWRAGANEATIFETDKAIKVEGKNLPAGKYSLFVLPGEKEATVIFNSETGQWGIKQDGNANLDRSKDVLSVAVKPVKSSAKTEKLAYEVNGKGLALKWD
ncbi:MAG TPA: DUF2911 domain-containing protein, partial [Chryseolinea sp.]|nr:DUF2911 domain-containing protein [Chryseolinea sp.]